MQKVYTYEEVFEIAKQYEYKVDLMRNNRGAYDAALRNNWLNDFDWFHDGLKRTGENHRKWNYETCFKEAFKYKTRGEFGTKSSRAYWIAIQNGWIDTYGLKIILNIEKITTHVISVWNWQRSILAWLFLERNNMEHITLQRKIIGLMIIRG